MKIPKRAPTLLEIIECISREQLGAIVGREATYEGDYIHWDKLRRLKPVDGLAVEQWWAALKMARSGLLRAVPLSDKGGQTFKFGMPDPVLKILYRIDQGAAGRIELPDPITNPQTRDRYVVSSLMEEAIRSSQLEGAATTRRIAKEMIRSGRTPQTRDEQMIFNNYTAMQQIRELKSQALTADLILHLHRILTEKTLDVSSAAGRLRSEDEDVRVEDLHGEVLHIPPPASELPDRMLAMCDFANEKTPARFVHPVIRAIILHFWLAYDHPFVDGNGRCARALFYWSMLKQGYWLCEFISISDVILKAPAQYSRAFLHTETDENDLTYFILYHLEVITRSIQELHDYIGRKMREAQSLEMRLRTGAIFNHRQRELLLHALRQPQTIFTFDSHQRSHGIVYQTARTDLLDLVAQGLLEPRKGVGKKMRFVAAKNLEDRLEQRSTE